VDQRYFKYLEDLARDQVEAGFLGHAEESFQILGQYLPQEPAIWENVAMIQLRTGRFEEALATLARTEALRKSSRTSFQVGFCLMKLGRLGEAEERWKALLPALGDSEDDQALAPSVKVLYASCLLLSGRPKPMLELTAPWPEASANGELAALRAQALIQTGDWKPARTALKDGMARFNAEELFQRAAALPPKTFEEGLFFQAGPRKAMEQLDLESMASLWATFRSWNRCLEAVQQARRDGPVRDVDLLLMQANALENLGRPDEAIQVLREGQKLDPGHPVLQNNLGFSLLEHGGDLEEAARLIRAALDKDPKNGSTMDSWGWALYKQGKYAEAEKALRQATELSPFSPEAHKHLGEALLKLDRLQDALDEWERALAYAFPQRKELEQQTQALRVRLARDSADGQAAPAADPGDDSADDTEEND
jgi:tetratricopeptide (TPR) repeat protein